MAEEKLKVIVGLGETGISCARYFRRHGIPFAVMDRDPNPRHLPALRSLAPEARFSTIDGDALLSAAEIVVSPGVPLATPELQAAARAGVPLTGDVAIFAREASAPIVAITGSNGKSTVTALVGEMARDQGKATGVGGNIGTPCLDLVDDDSELYVLEVSSYQLETAHPLACEVAVVLNLSPDHLDRYDAVDDYYRTKTGIYQACNKAVVNRDMTVAFDIPDVDIRYFGATAPSGPDDFGLVRQGGSDWLAMGDDLLIAAEQLGIRGRHNQVNALAALAIGSLLAFDLATMLDTLRRFGGLEHRCEFLGKHDGVDYFNDSKSTNIDSTRAAVEGLAVESRKNIVLILGGIDKGADFSGLADTVARHVKLLIVFGRDAGNIVAALENSTAIETCDDMEAVVELAVEQSAEGDAVLFSPACASFDMFDNFEHRGRVFKSVLQEQLS